MLKVNIRTDRSGQWLEHSILHLSRRPRPTAQGAM